MYIGIFSRTFVRPTLRDVLDAVVSYGLSHVHFNLSSAGVPSLPDEIDDELCAAIRRGFTARGLTMTSVSATFNAIHPDVRKRDREVRLACMLIKSCRQLGTSVATLCTGTRDPDDMWRHHQDNDSAAAWQDLLATLDILLPVAESSGVTLGIEPETNNVVDSASKARRLLDELCSSHLKIIMDGANLFHEGETFRMEKILSEAFTLLAPDIVMVHAKDIAGPTTRGSQAAGSGKLDWLTYFGLLREHRYDGPVILHNLTEAEVDQSIAFVKDRLAHAFC
jgi:sugar phosphate isomerase/epimerase